jgi:YVTN family beta-propeller protein
MKSKWTKNAWVWTALTATALTLFAVSLLAATGYKVTGKIKVGGNGGWDYVYIDSAAQRLYASHTNQTEVIDLAAGKPVGMIAETTGVHGIAIAADLGKGFTSNGRANAVGVFDPKTLMVTGKIDVGKNPDAILYDAATHRLFTFNGASKDASVIDAKTNMVIATIPIGGKPEFAQADGKGNVYVNNEDANELVVIDAAKATITRRIALEGCDEPSGLAIDTAKVRLFSVCGNQVMMVTDPVAGKVLAKLPIGKGADGVAFDNGMAFSSNGQDGNITVVGEQGGKYAVLDTVATQLSARTIGVDPKTHKLYLPAADLLASEDKDGKKGRPRPAPDSFSIVIVSK